MNYSMWFMLVKVIHSSSGFCKRMSSSKESEVRQRLVAQQLGTNAIEDYEVKLSYLLVSSVTNQSSIKKGNKKGKGKKSVLVANAYSTSRIIAQ